MKKTIKRISLFFCLLLVFQYLSFVHIDIPNFTIAYAKTQNEDKNPPSVPQELITQNISQNEISLSWTESNDNIAVEGYIVYRNGTEFTRVAGVNVVTDTGVVPSTTYTYEVSAYDAANNESAKSNPLQIRTLDTSISGNGLKANYFNAMDFNGARYTTIDGVVDFNWKNKSAPAPGINGEKFSARWTGQIEVPYSEAYTIYTEAHGGVRLWINDNLIIDDWAAHNMSHQSGEILLEAGKRYNIKLEYNEDNGVAKVQLLWSSPSQTQEVIPQSRMYSVGIPDNVTVVSYLNYMNIAWGQIAYFTGYDIEVDGVTIDNGTSTSYTQTGLIPGTAHTYRVRARNEMVIGTWSSLFPEATLLQVPGNIVTSADENNISLSWGQIEGATGYDIEVDGDVKDNGSSVAYSHTGLIVGTKHIYRIRAKTQARIGEWTFGIEKWTLPITPQNIELTSTGNTITLTWDYVTGATGYDVEVQGSPVDNGSNTTFTDTGLNPNLQKIYRVRAKNSSGFGKWSSIVAKTTLVDQPSNLRYTSTDNEIKVTWDGVAGVTSYDIEVDGATVIAVSDTLYLHSGLLPNTQHFYRVRAKNADGAGSWSENIQATTLLTVPAQLEAKVMGDSIIVTWDVVENAAGYDIEVDGIMIDNKNSTTFTHKGFSLNTEHTYRVRAKNGEVSSLWSKEVTRKTLAGVPTNLTTFVTSSSIRVSWDTVVGATGYDIELDGVVTDNGMNTVYIHNGLIPKTQHTYRVRTRNAGGASEWSEAVSQTTILGTPENLTAAVTETAITLAWNDVEGADGYDVMVDGVVLDNGNNKTYFHNSLEPSSIHVYRVRAKSSGIPGEWSNAVTYSTGLGIPANLKAVATGLKITLIWDEVSGATGYDVEADGEIINVGNDTIYVHEKLLPNTEHKYRVRARNSKMTGEWSAILKKKTTPGVPKNFKAEAETQKIKLIWDTSEGALGYDLEVDGKIVEGIQNTEYVHQELQSNTMHIYRVRAKSEDEPGEWSDPLEQNTIPEVKVNVGKDNMFNFVIAVSKKKDVQIQTVVVTYNPDELDVVDLCGATKKAELTTGTIQGTTIEVTELAPGMITFTVRNADKSVVNVIRFLSKTNEVSKVTYQIK